MILILIQIILAYLIGSIPSAVWIGKAVYGIDVRQHGSGNAGATNVIRVLGYKAGIPVMLFDVFKGWLAVFITSLFPDQGMTPDQIVYVEIGAAVAAALGHVFPVFAGFRGGKGVGTMAGVGIALYWQALLIVLGIFIIVLVISRYVSLSSCIAATAFPFIVVFITGTRHPGLVILSVFVAVFVLFTHRSNILRLAKGQENKFNFKGGGKK
ncbi:MAG: glycerol-3-phosphate 1-O-acyltransferase PlsY [Bacteroidetes bacterium]|nr:glycerol-3-phosphate 1-O-acyltransferase PlsY [Bacteroidota bacterium]